MLWPWDYIIIYTYPLSAKKTSFKLFLSLILIYLTWILSCIMSHPKQLYLNYNNNNRICKFFILIHRWPCFGQLLYMVISIFPMTDIFKAALILYAMHALILFGIIISIQITGCVSSPKNSNFCAYKSYIYIYIYIQSLSIDYLKDTL